ncbi:hypothetical protein EL22_15505 [Halostagnicola sp. A56]|uniref:NAD-dependent epimerase/dehydratase family protein n=1 Tax=Halostagnicola sp. A56 TaxID=1495067 RepID=UPI0004A09B59|nr:NAD-dependent epimerase/dehydratase family protein [Halostagnicola sp. A56]KDE59890.1 hypothetical protein EL22_15505 [Halostagnicola sp. A56]
MSDESPVAISGQDVLVTGGAGFIGSNIVEALVPENDVRVLDNLSSGARSNVPSGATFIEGDIRDDATVRHATEGIDIIFHQAGQISVERSFEAPELTHEVNVTATLKLLECARRESARFVFASSAAVYGHPESIPLSEAAPTEPTSPYGASKLAAEQYVRLYDDHYDLQAVSLRYFNVYGAGQVGGDYSAVISVFVDQALNGDPITVDGDGSQTRDFVHVRDVVRANLLAGAADDCDTVFNVGTGESHSILELAEVVRSVAGSESEIVHRRERTGDISDSEADLAAIRSQLGYEPTISIESGMEELITSLE